MRVFSEGVPHCRHREELRLIRNLGGESDSASRQVARYIAEIGRTYQTGVKPLLEFRLDRYLRGGDHFRSTSRVTQPSASPNIARTINHQHQNVRTENGIEYGDVPKWVNFDYVAGVAR